MDELVLVDFDGDFLITAAVELDFRDAIGLLEDILEIIFCLAVDIVQGVGRLDGDVHDRRRVDVALDDDWLVDIVRQAAADGIDFFRSVNGCRIGIGRKIKLQRNPGLAVRCRRRHMF